MGRAKWNPKPQKPAKVVGSGSLTKPRSPGFGNVGHKKAAPQVIKHPLS